MHVVSQPPLQRARLQLSIAEILHFTAHHRFERQLFGETHDNKFLIDSENILEYGPGNNIVSK